MTEQERLQEIVFSSKNIAIVGLSRNNNKPSRIVADFLLTKGYNVIPINPNLNEWNGKQTYESLETASLSNEIEIVDVFVRPENIEQIVKEAVEIKPKLIWLQEGLSSKAAADLAKKAGIPIVMDKCLKKFIAESTKQ